MERQNTYETVGIIGAMKVEIEEIQKKLQDVSTETISGIEYVQGMLCGKKVIAAKCGVGKVFAAVCAQTMVLRYAPDCILQTGVAGGLTDPLAPLDLVVATHVVQYDMDTSAVGDPPGMLSGINIVQIRRTAHRRAVPGCRPAWAGTGNRYRRHGRHFCMHGSAAQPHPGAICSRRL